MGVKKEQGITLHLISERVNNGATELNNDILFFLNAHLDTSLHGLKFNRR